MALLLVIRHGETDWNRDRRIQGHEDVPLNATGREQALALADELAAELGPELKGRPGAGLPIFTSDLRRARETARLVAEALGGRPRPLRGLRERGFGVLEGKTWAELTALHPEAVRAYRSGDDRDAVPGSEPLAAFRRRALAAAREVAAAAERAVVVTHGGVLKVLLEEALGPGKRFAISNCACYRLRVEGATIERVFGRGKGRGRGKA